MSELSKPGSSTAVPAFGSGVTTISLIRALLIILLAISFAVVVLAAFHRPIKGDEYIFLSQIHRAVSGEKLGLLQTAYVHFFRWLPYIGQDEIAQYTVGRLISVGLWAVSLLLLHELGRRLLDPLAALVTVVLFALFSYSVANAFNFRIDVLLLPILLSVTLLLLHPTVTRVTAAGALSGLALALTIKTVLWAPAFVGVLAVGLWDSQQRLRPILAGTIAGAVTFGGILLSHRWAISTETDAGLGVSVPGLVSLGTYMFYDGFVPQSKVLWRAVVGNAATWVLILIGLAIVLAGLREPQSRRNSLILLLLASPIVSVIFYTNAFPYAYLVLIPTACLLAGKAFSRFMGTAEGLKGVAAIICLGSAAIPMTYMAWQLRADQTQQQRQVLSAVHQLFEEPVHYIDLSGMVASFPRKMPAITRAVLTPYRGAGVPLVTNYIHKSKPPLLILNSPSLDVWSEELESLDPDTRLLPQDEETIRATYAHYWDQIYLAGRQWRDLRAGERHAFEIVIPGEHTVLASSPVVVDGRTFSPGATITLTAGPHELRTTAAEPDLRILWGRDLELPAAQ